MKVRNTISAKELRVLILVSELKTTQEIASELGVASKTVENQRYSIARKLNLSGNNCVLKFALEHRKELVKSGNKQ